PMYMSEVSPKNMRGRALSMQQFAIVFGQILIFYVNYKIASIAADTWLIELGWRYMFAAGIIPCILFCIIVIQLPETPRWMMMIGREAETQKIRTKRSTEEHARQLLAEIKTSLQNDQLTAHQKLHYRDGTVRFILILGCMIAM
ncbi:myo-inositol import MFS transporter IolT1, partial [Salmonella enterica subsp. enterica serovar Oslo]|nr:myo-inositol import MFS transporter IolT1 [Salmonella enterica subsp. enterica serovar Oslo]